MKFENLRRRLRSLRQTKGPREATLTFRDGSTRAIRVRAQNELNLLLDTFAKMRSYPPTPPEGIVLPPPLAEAATANDKAIALLGGAESLEGPRLLQTIHSLCRQIKERKDKNRNESSHS